jgi:4-hydroxy-3-polyprenylbenzoate decarboxylase
MKRLIVAITGASGAAYAQAFCRYVAGSPSLAVDLIVSPNGRKVCRHELGLDDVTPAALVGPGRSVANFTVWPHDELAAGPSSGSYPADGMVIIPASGHAIAAVAHGLSDNLIVRAALVTLKQKRRLVVVPRETPVGVIELRNQLVLAEAGAVILPASPGFYQRPGSVDDLLAFVVGKVAEMFDLPHELYRRWTGREIGGE